MIEIKHRFTSNVLFACDAENMRHAVIQAITSRANLSRANLSGAYLSGAELSGADLSGANLSGAGLSRANLSGAYLSGADLSGACLSGAYLSGAYLSGANLSGADLSGAYLPGANLSGANLSGAKYGEATMERRLFQINGLKWPVMIFDAHIKIGCQFHLTEDWKKFDDAKINNMASDALEFWNKHKSFILAASEQL